MFSSLSVVTTVSTPVRERAATPAARRIDSAGHSSRGAPSPTATTLATGSDGATRRVTCSAPPLAVRARSAASISAMLSGVNAPPATTLGEPPSPSSESAAASLTTGTINTTGPLPGLGSESMTVTVGAV